MQALADPTRWLMVHQLSKHEASIGEIAQAMGLSAANTSHHVSILIDAEVVQVRRSGRRTLARLAAGPERAAALLRSLGIQPTSSLLSGRAAGGSSVDAIPELDSRSSIKTVRYSSNEMDDFLL